MDDELINYLIKKVFAKLDNRNRAGLKKNLSMSECLPEEVLCDYLESNLSDRERNNVERHLVYCPYCQDILISTVKLELEEKAVKEKVKEKIADLVKPVNISIAWVKGHLRLIETGADYPKFWDALIPVMVRNSNMDKAATLPPLLVDSGGYSLYLQIVEQQMQRCKLQCRYFPGAKSKPGLKMHADLIEEGKVIISYPFKEETVYFNNITPGRYELRIYEIRIKAAGIHTIAIFPINIEEEAG